MTLKQAVVMRRQQRSQLHSPQGHWRLPAAWSHCHLRLLLQLLLLGCLWLEMGACPCLCLHAGLPQAARILQARAAAAVLAAAAVPGYPQALLACQFVPMKNFPASLWHVLPAADAAAEALVEPDMREPAVVAAAL
jgi:hypothetical protein